MGWRPSNAGIRHELKTGKFKRKAVTGLIRHNSERACVLIEFVWGGSIKRAVTPPEPLDRHRGVSRAAAALRQVERSKRSDVLRVSPGALCLHSGICGSALGDAVQLSVMTIEQLTPREKECLRLLLTPMRAKEVARATGLSVNTVNEHLKSARRKLGTSDSWSAAQLLRALEDPTNSSDTNKSGSHPAALVNEKGATDTSALKPAAVVEKSRFLPFATKGRPWNDMDFGWRLLWPLLLFGIIALGAGALMGAASGLSQLTLALTR